MWFGGSQFSGISRVIAQIVCANMSLAKLLCAYSHGVESTLCNRPIFPVFIFLQLVWTEESSRQVASEQHGESKVSSDL